MRDAVQGPSVADRPDDGHRLRHGCFTPRTMQRLRTSRSITSSLLSRLSWAFSRLSRSGSSSPPPRAVPARRTRDTQLAGVVS